MSTLLLMLLALLLAQPADPESSSAPAPSSLRSVALEQPANTPQTTGTVLVEAVGDGAVGSVPTVWERGNTYRVYVYAMNDHPTEIIDGASWKLIVPSAYAGYVLSAGSFGRPSSELDLFDGEPMFFSDYDNVGQLSSAIIEQIGGGAAPGESGYLEYYDVYVTEDSPLGEFEFVLSSLGFRNPQNQVIPFAHTNDFSFRIVAQDCEECYGDIDENGIVDLVDFSLFAACYGEVAPTENCPEENLIKADIGTHNGEIELTDFAEFAANFGATSPLVQDDSP